MKKLLPLIIAILSTTAYATEQPDSITVSGKVLYETDNEPIPGVSVLNIVQSKIALGTSTDIDGNFSLRVPLNSQIVFSFPGLLPDTINIYPNITLPLICKLNDVKGHLEYIKQPPRLKFFITDKENNPIRDAQLWIRDARVWSYAIFEPEMFVKYILGVTDGSGSVESYFGRWKFISPNIQICYAPLKKQTFFISKPGYKTKRIVVKKPKNTSKEKIIKVKLQKE